MNGDVLGEATADASGAFFLFADLGASEDPRVLTLTETWLDGTTVEAPASVILAPVPPLEVAEAEDQAEPEAVVTEGVAAEDAAESVEGANEGAEVALADSGAPADEAATGAVDEAASEEVAALDTDSRVEPDAADDAPSAPADGRSGEDGADVAAVEATPLPDASQPAAPTVLLADEEGVRVLQSSGDQPEALANITIDAISYDAEGEVSLSGRSTGASAVRVYLNNKPLIDTEIGESGQWRTELPDVDTGTYTLRVDELDAEGAVISRAETPFKREAVEDIRALDTAPSAEIAPVSLITVQPGNTLWGIAREKYGEGLLYVRVFRGQQRPYPQPGPDLSGADLHCSGLTPHEAGSGAWAGVSGLCGGHGLAAPAFHLSVLARGRHPSGV